MFNTSGALHTLRAASRFILLMASLGSLAFVLWAGRNNHSVLLRLLFVLWVISPFFGLLMSHTLSRKWAASVRRMIYILTIVISVCSIFFYSPMFNPPGMKPAFKFLVLPLVFWFIIAVIIPATASRSRKTMEEQDRM